MKIELCMLFGVWMNVIFSFFVFWEDLVGINFGSVRLVLWLFI